MLSQSIALILGLCASAIAVPHPPQDDKSDMKSFLESSTIIKKPPFTHVPSPTKPPGDDDDSGEFPFPWPTDFPDFPNNDGKHGGDSDDASDGHDGEDSTKPKSTSPNHGDEHSWGDDGKKDSGN
ncbi:hypothetical protein BBP40_003006 [Aspergillus hancockii]|nr:hypothetical protein BBP40_003006 [Aspergillus hancockii]